jgi:hypothetical protein
MALARDDLVAILRAGGLAQTDESFAALETGLNRLAALYPIVKLSFTAPRSGRQRASLRRFRAAVKVIGKILDDDFEAGLELQTLLDGFGAPASRETLAWLRRLPSAIDAALVMIEQARDPRPRHQENAATWSFVALHDLFEFIDKKPPEIGKCLERFTVEAIVRLRLPIAVPAGASFARRVKAALERRRIEKTELERRIEKLQLMPPPVLGR